MPCLVRTVAPGEGLWGNPACLIEASSATSGDETRLRTTASPPGLQSVPVQSAGTAGTWAGQWACGTRLDREGTWAAGIELGRRDGEN